MASEFVSDREMMLNGAMQTIVAAYVSNNSVPASSLPSLIDSVHSAVARCLNGAAPLVAEPEIVKPSAGQIAKSITPDALISFIDGKPYKTLKRHVSKHGLDEHSYRARYGLAADYPMVSASYSAQRSELAKAIGLGTIGSRAPEQIAA